MPRTSPSGSGTQPWTCSHVSSDADRRRERTSVVALANSGFMKHLNLVSIKPAAAHTDCKPPFARQRRPQASEVGLLSSFFAPRQSAARRSPATAATARTGSGTIRSPLDRNAGRALSRERLIEFGRKRGRDRGATCPIPPSGHASPSATTATRGMPPRRRALQTTLSVRRVECRSIRYWPLH
jgi:hypothetical protein